MERKLAIEKLQAKYWLHEGKARIYLEKIVDEVRKYSSLSNDDFTVNVFPGDGIGICPESVFNKDGIDTYISVGDIIAAMKRGEKLDERWFGNNRSL